MTSLTRALLRTLCAIAVCTSYVLPSTARLVADVGHTIDHVVEDGNRRNGRPTRATMVHTHDGSTHGHRVAVGQLIDGADRADEGDRAAGLFVVLGSHLPIARSEPTFAQRVDAPARPESDGPVASEAVLPSLPPPRA